MKQPPHWLVRRSTITRLWIVFLAVLALTVAAEAVIVRHGYFRLDGTPGFNAWFGFAACVALIFVAKLLGMLLKRTDTYYDDER